MKKLLIILCIITVSFCFGQKENITLPNIKSEVKYSKTTITPIFSVYVNTNKEVYFENQKVPVEKLGDTIFKYKNQFSPYKTLILQVHILADKKVDYSLIDKVKTQIHSAKHHRLIYRTGEYLEDIASGIFFFDLFDKFGALHYKEEPKLEEEEYIVETLEVPLPFDHKERTLKDKLYNLEFNEAKALLKKFKYAKIKFIGNKKVLIDGKKYKLATPEVIEKLIQKKDLVIATFSEKLSYNDYLKNIIVLKKIYRKNKKKQLKTAFYFEISGELQQEMDKKDFKL